MIPSVTSRVVLAVALVCGSPVLATAGPDYTLLNAQRGAELSLFGGAAATSFGPAPSFGWSIGWRPSARVVIEGGGSWVPNSGVDGFAALFGTRLYTSLRHRASPFLSLEGGLFHASVSGSDPDVPDFYRDRMIPGAGEKAFNDFVAAGGGGFDVHLRGRMWLRPTGRVLVVVDGWRSHVMFLGGLNLSFSFGGSSSP